MGEALGEETFRPSITEGTVDGELVLIREK